MASVEPWRLLGSRSRSSRARRSPRRLRTSRSAPPDPVATFSILGYDPDTGEVGGAVQSRVFSVGNGVLWGEAEVGMVATQAIVDVSYGPQALQLLKKGLAPADIVKTIWDGDPDPGLGKNPWPKAGRQFAVMDAKGSYAAFTGPKATPWAGNKGGKFCTAQGNILAGEAVVGGMVDAFEKTTGPLSLRLMAALDAGQAARRRHAGHAIGGDAHRQEERRRVAPQRRRPAPAGRRQPRAAQRAAPPRRDAREAVRSAARAASTRNTVALAYFVFRSVRVTRPSPPDSGVPTIARTT